MDARAEAKALVGGRFRPRVLEPSPPAVSAPPWFADDPVLGWKGSPEEGDGDDTDDGEAAFSEQLPLLLPVSLGERTWDGLAASEPGLAEWCADRWLGAWRRLPSLPAAFAETRHALHAVAEHALSAVRHTATGKIGLRYTQGGFGTPFFAEDRQVRIRGGELIVQVGRVEQRAALTTLRNAAAIIGVPPGAPEDIFTPTTPLQLDARLRITTEASRALGEWYGFACSILEQLRAESRPETEPSRVQLWPEHFDMAVEVGRKNEGRRAAFGGSPGDDAHPEPYLYVAPWQGISNDPFWNASGFAGAELSYADLQRASDQRAAALSFLRRGRALLDQNATTTG